MKIKTGFIICLFILALKANSQEYTFGIKTGPNIVNLKTSGYKGVDNSFIKKSSFHIELIVNHSINEKIQIQIEPGFIEKGGKIINTYPHEYGAHKYGFITIPTVLILKPVNNLNFEIGTEFAFLIYSKIMYANGDTYNEIKEDPGFKSFEISGLTGISYNICKYFILGIRYGIALTPVYVGKYEILYTADPPYKLYTRYFEFSARVFIFKTHKVT